MLFKRRTPPTKYEQLRIAVWPRRNFSRSGRYFIKRVLRLSASPHAVALGFAAGAFASFTPFVGFHFIIAFALAFIIGGNLLAAALGTSVGNPLTFPFIWASAYELGHRILGGKSVAAGKLSSHMQEGMLHKSLDALWPLIKPMIVGGIPLGLVCGTVLYFVVYYAVKAYQTRRHKRLARRRAEESRKIAERLDRAEKQAASSRELNG